MKTKELLNALNWLNVETGSLACLGCGHEHNCSVCGCAIIREAAERIESIAENAQALRDCCEPEDTFSRELVLQMIGEDDLEAETDAAD